MAELPDASFQKILRNITRTQESMAQAGDLGRICVVTSSAAERQFWQRRFLLRQKALGSVPVCVLEEKIGTKTRAGNFLGTLLAFSHLQKSNDPQENFLLNEVILLGMLFGRGERISPFSQIKGNCKSAISVQAPRGQPGPAFSVSAAEEALLYFRPLTSFLKRQGFRGILCKWGDETQVPALDFFPETALDDFEACDILKCVSVIEITEELAKEKDWVAFGPDGRMLAQIARQPRASLARALQSFGQEAQAGVSLGPVAVSFRFLQVARDVFQKEMVCDGVFLDFDPYVLMALCLAEHPARWQTIVSQDASFKKIQAMVPDFFAKIQTLRQEFFRRYGRPLSMKVLNLGEDVFWLDIGQHESMFRRCLAVNQDDAYGMLCRSLEQLPHTRDSNGNILVDAMVAPGIQVRNSVIVHSILWGSGTVTNSVIKNCLLGDVQMKNAFAVDSVRSGVVLASGSGLYESVGMTPVVLAEKERSGTLMTPEAPLDLKVEERTDLRDKPRCYESTILNNPLSFQEAYERMAALDFRDLERLRQRRAEPLFEAAWQALQAQRDALHLEARLFQQARHILGNMKQIFFHK